MSSAANIPRPVASGSPTFTVMVEDRSVSHMHHVLSIYVFKAVNKIPSARIVVSDILPSHGDASIGDQDDFMPGKTVMIEAGYSADESLIFKGIIIEQSIKRNKRCRNIIVECKDLSVKLTMGEKYRTFPKAKDSEIMQEIIEAYGDPDLKAGALDYVKIENEDEPRYQHRLTDWDFMLGLAEINGVLLLADEGTLSAIKPDMSADPVLSLEEGDTMLDFKASSDARHQFQSVKTITWNSATQEFDTIESADPGIPDQGSLKAKELANVIGLDTFMLPAGVLSEQEKQAQANAALLRSRMAKIKGSVKCQGFAGVKPGDIIELKGVGERFNGKAFVAGVRHEIGKAGQCWVTEIQFGLDIESSTPRSFTKADKTKLESLIPGLQIGKVTQLEGDPKKEDRVRVKIPAVDNEDDGVWARIASLDAGENRGAFFRPEIDDEVILGFLNDDPRYPVILGMLNSKAKPAPITASDDNHEKGFITRDALKLLFNDEKKLVTIETPNGNVLSMSDEDGGIALEDENGNSIIMNADGIALQDGNRNSIIMNTDGIALESGKDLVIKSQSDIKIEGINVEASAQAQLKGEGSAGAEISANGNTVIKGAMVMIN